MSSKVEEAETMADVGPKGADCTDIESDEVAIIPEGFTSSFTDKKIRARFIRKVYSILLSQLLLTTAIIACFCFIPQVKDFYCSRTYTDLNGLVHCMAVSNNGLTLYIVSYVIFLAVYITLSCCESVRRSSPGNLVALLVFTVALSVLASSIAIFHDVYWVMISVGLTAAVCLGLTLFSFQTKWDFTGWEIYLFAASWILFCFGLVSIFFVAKGLPMMNLVYSGLVGLLFAMLLVVDTQKIMGGKKYSISPEEHIYAAMQLYIDIVYVFLAILRMGRR